MNVNAHVDTLGRLLVSLKQISNVLLNPSGGTSEEPGRKMKMFFRVGDMGIIWKINKVEPSHSMLKLQ